MAFSAAAFAGIVRGEGVAHDNAGARRGDPNHFGEGDGGGFQMVEGEPAGDHVERPVRKGRPVHVAEPPFHVADAFAGREGARLLQHGRRCVESDDVAHALGHRAGHGAGTAGEVDGLIVWLRTGRRDDERHHVVGVEFPGAGESGGLAGELVLNRAVVRV